MDSSDKPQLLTDHITALRGCLLRSILFLAIGFFAIFIFFAPDLIKFVLAPVRSYSFILGRVPDVGSLIAIHVLDKFVVTLLISVIGAFFFSVPYSFFELWNFLKPALKLNERHVFIAFFPFVMIFFIMGSMFGYLFVIPVSIDFLTNFGNESFALAGVETSITILSYLRYFFMMTFFLGLIFELPIIMMLVVRVTDLEPKSFAKYRRHFVVLSFIIAMLLTPPDVVTQIMLALPMILMYEIGIILTRIAHRKKIRIRNDFMEDKVNFENSIENKPSENIEDTPKTDIITGFNSNMAKIDNEKVFENKLTDSNDFGIIELGSSKDTEISSENVQEGRIQAGLNPELEKYFNDPTLSALSKEQIKAFLKLIEMYLEEKNSKTDK